MEKNEMKTENLIKMLAQDAAVSFRLAPMMRIMLLLGVSASATLLLLKVGIRTDIAEAIFDGRVLFKLGITFLSALLAVNLLLRVGRPEANLRLPALLMMIPLVIMILGVLTELLTVPPSLWAAKTMGRNPMVCLVVIPILSLAPMAGSMAVLRRAAPDNPGVAGAVAGLAAGCLAASLYAWRCPDDSPLFLAVWYTLSITTLSGTGYLFGKRALRW
jgi:hypothetical protein